MTLIDNYFKQQSYFTDKYGPKTIVLMEVGKFYEIYGLETKKERIGDVYTVANLLNILVSRRNGKEKDISRKNPLMAGFPNYTIDKYVKILLKHKYTIIQIDQDSHGKKNPKRIITKIHSPGTDVDYKETFKSNFLASIHIEVSSCINSVYSQFICGLSIIDVTTGFNYIYEFSIKHQKIIFALSQLKEKLLLINPNEIVWSATVCTDSISAVINNFFSLQSCPCHKTIIEPLKLQNHILSSVFSNNTNHSIFDFLHIIRLTFACTSYVNLIKFVKSHNANALTKLEKPEIRNFSKMLCLTNTTINQLHIVSTNNNQASINSIVNKCFTSLGKRCLLHRLTHPIYDSEILQKRYDGISKFMEKTTDEQYIFHKTGEHLRNIIDIERGHRRMRIGNLHPSQCASLCISYERIKDLLVTLQNTSAKHIHVFKKETELDKFIAEFTSVFDILQLSKYHLDTIGKSFFIKGKFPSLDEYEHRLDQLMLELEQLCKSYSDFIDPKKSSIRLLHNERDGYYMNVTKKRFEILSKSDANKSTNNDNLPLLSSFIIQKTKNDVKLLGGKLGIISDSMFKIKTQLISSVKEQYLKITEEWSNKYNELFLHAIDFIKEVDVTTSGAYCALNYNYTCPKITSAVDQDKPSYVSFKQIRHPIIENIYDKVPYVPNDICIGKCGSQNQQGILLYGVNAAGKSSLMKAVGTNLILAQAGLFVAASEMKYIPYTHIFTRLTKNDDLHSGKSSFAVEMCELRNILIRANKNSLVLGDELCSGTESTSALSIVSAGIQSLYKKESSFLFATHLHELHKLDIVQKLPNLVKYHLTVIYEPSTDNLIYNRKLVKGVGSSLYGLEVCKGMDMPKEFIETALKVREQIAKNKGEMVDTQISSYNAKSIRHKCEICSNPATDTHHIQYQKEANEIQMIGSIHKNRLSNLVGLCTSCHNSVHNDELLINGYIQTSKGIMLEYKWVEKPNKKNRKKFNENHIEWLTKQNRDKISKSLLQKLFKKEFNTSISLTTMSNIQKGSY
tara:strand:- start:344 stop:3400 length:3057 start_codon:yes stop_codon:yes gene_type:complete